MVHSSRDQFDWFVGLFCVFKKNIYIYIYIYICIYIYIKLLILLGVRYLHSQVQPMKLFEFSSLFP